MNGPISKVDAAKEQLDGALDLIDSRSLCAHALAYNAYCLLRDLLSVDMTKFEKALRLREVAEFIKHAKSDPYDILTEHSPKTAHLVTVAAIALWEANEQRLTDAMRDSRRGLTHISRVIVTVQPFSRCNKARFPTLPAS